MGEVEAMNFVNFDERPKPEPVERVPLFALDGVEYTIPAKLRPNVGLRYLWALKTKGDAAATAELLSMVLGDEGLEALSGTDKLTDEDMSLIVGIVTKLALGTTEGNGD